MTVDFLARLYICAIIIIGACLFLAVDELEPNRRIGIAFKCATLAQAVGRLSIS